MVYTGKHDRLFKTLVVEEEGNRLLKKILESILHVKIEELEILRNEFPIEEIRERVKTVDLLVKTKEKYIHVELNTSTGYRFRNFILFSNIISVKTKRGESYNPKEEYIHIDLNYVKGNKGREISEYYIQTLEGRKYVKNIQIIEYNIDKKNEFWYTKSGKAREEYKYLLLLDLEPEEIEKKLKGDELAMEYKDKIEEINQSGEFRAFITVEEDLRKKMNTERELGIEEGIEQTKKEMILNLYSVGDSLEKIAKVVNLS